MTRHQAINAGITALSTLLFVLLLSASYLLDGPDRRDEWAESTSLQLAQAQAELDARIQKSAQALCNADRGPNSEARWTEDNQLVCTTRKGFKPLQVGAL